MSLDIKAAIKKPWVKYGLIAVGVIGAFYIFRSASSSSSDTTNSTGESDADYAADQQTAQTQIAAAASAASQSSAQTFQLSQQQETDQTNLAAQAATIAGQESINSNNNATSISLGNIQLQGLQAQLGEALGIQQIQADEQEHISDNQTAVAIGQSNNSASVQKNQTNKGFAGTIIGSVLSMF